MNNYIYKLSQLVLMISFAFSLTSCRETFDDLFSSDIAEGEEVMFTTSLPSASVTRSTLEDYNTQMAAYKTVSEAYEFTIGIYAESSAAPIGSSIYQLDSLDTTGLLCSKAGTTPLYWPSTTVPYAFKATAGTETLEADQSTKAQWLLQDQLEGYGYIQKWDTDKSAPLDNLNALNYHTAKDWKKLNSEVKLVSNDTDYKKIPIYLQHQRSLITIILKAGEGVSREALAFNVAENDLSDTIYSYSSATATPVLPLASETLIDYDADKNGAAASGVSSTRYDAIVEPYDYSANPSTDLITRISISGQHYSFYAQNDYNFDTNKDSYKLEAGKHLIITVTLSRDSRKVMMTAYIEDWTEEVTNTICDDYGNAGEPIKIKNRDELIAFLKDENKNKAGNIALVTQNINLEETYETYTGTWDAYNSYDLNCTLSLGGNTIISNHRFLESLGNAASLQNGTIQIGGTVDAAIANTNHGAIDDVKITAESATAAHATVAGAVISNTGTISRCHSSLKVANITTTDIIGGIAATSLSGGNAAVIDACTVTNRVCGGALGGGIVGQANGYVTNNVFEYGITLLQDSTTHKNIVGEVNSNHSFKTENNAWPTYNTNGSIKNSTAQTNLYHGIIDSEDELKASVGNTYNINNKRYRLAQDIEVKSTTGSVAYNLDGNNKTITTKAMIFNAVTGQIHDLTVYVASNLETTQDAAAATDAIAPLAFEVHGEKAAISNIKVKMADGTVIKASNPAGVVVWAYNGATVSNCEAQVNLYANVAKSVKQGRKFAGGIVSTVSKATVTQCILHSGSTLDGTEATVIYYGGIVGGIEKKNDSNDTPELTITDCTCFLTVTKDEKHGGILGNALLGTSETATKDCQGNWWPSDCNGVGTYVGSVEATIGKRNAVTPTEKDF